MTEQLKYITNIGKFLRKKKKGKVIEDKRWKNCYYIKRKHKPRKRCQDTHRCKGS